MQGYWGEHGAILALRSRESFQDERHHSAKEGQEALFVYRIRNRV
jgi:hypothetical protein